MPSSSRRPRRWLLIVDPTLRSFEGHSYNYDMAVAGVAVGSFDKVCIYADRHFRVPADAAIAIRPVLNLVPLDRLKGAANRLFTRLRGVRSLENASSMPGNATVVPSVPSRLVNFGKNLRALDLAHSLTQICRHLAASADDEVHVLLQHANIAEIVSIDRVVGSLARSGKARLVFHVILRYAPEIVNGRYESLDRFKERLERLCADSDPKGRLTVRFYTDSALLTDAYRALCARKDQFETLPIPVLAHGPDTSSAVRNGNGAGRARLAMLGAPRIEKGFGELPSIVGSLPHSIDGIPVDFLVQVSRNSDDPRVRTPIEWLDDYIRAPRSDGPHVEILNGPAPEAEYFSWFARTDILLAPYVSPKYTASTSGVFVEALYFSVPTVAMKGTWVASLIEAAAADGLRIGEVADGLGDLAPKAERIWRQLADYRRDVAEYLKRWQRFHTPQRFVEALLKAAS